MTQSPADSDLLAVARRYAADIVAPNAAAWNRAGGLPRAEFKRAAALGLTGIEVPKALGGQECSFATKARIAHVLAAADFGVAMALINTQNVALQLTDHLDLPSTQAHLAELLSGERIGCTALTEPGAGSDFAAITTRAEPIADGWVLNGEKAWITNATVADSIVTYVQTKTPGDMSGIAAVLIDARRDGFDRGAPSGLTGLHTIGSGAFRLTNYVARRDEMLGEPGAAFKTILRAINGARIYVAAMCCGMLRAAIEDVGAYGAARRTFGKALHDHQGWRWRLAEAASETAAVEALVEAAAAQVDAGGDTQLVAAQTKIAATRAAERHLPALAHLVGAAGLTQERVLGRHLEGVRFAGFVDGATEILLERVAKLMRPRTS